MIHCTPGYALTLAHEFRQRGVRPDEISLRFAIVGAEPWSEAMRDEIDAGLGVRSTNLYGLSEVVGPGVSCECVEARDGSHINEDHFLPEVVDPETHEPLPEGEVGVLVLTTLTKEALPVVRYWTGDLASLTSDPCVCGRTLIKMSRIRGRTDDMLIIRGVNVFPTQVEEVLGRIVELGPHYQLVVSRTGTLDEIEVRTELTEEFHRSVGVEHLSEDVIEADDTLRTVRQRTSELLKESIGCTMKVSLVTPGSVPRSDGGKLARVRRPPRIGARAMTPPTQNAGALAEWQEHLRQDIESIYSDLTDGLRSLLRVSELVYAAAERFPEQLPTRAAIAAERELAQKDKLGLEINQGIFVAHVLASPRAGRHLLHAMSQPRPDAAGAARRLPAPREHRPRPCAGRSRGRARPRDDAESRLPERRGRRDRGRSRAGRRSRPPR